MDNTKTIEQRHEMNSRFAQLARQGDQEALARLWEINKPVLHTMFWRWYSRNQRTAEAAGVTMDDLEQEGIFAVKRAAEYHNPEKGSFLTALQYCVLHQIREAVGCVHYTTAKDGNKTRILSEPLNTAQSLDEVLPGTGDEARTRGDITPDPAAALELEKAEQDYYLETLRAVLNEALSLLPDRQREIIVQRFYDDLTLKQAAEATGITPEQARRLEYYAFRALRQNAGLRRFYGEDLLSRAYQGTGFGTWKSGGSVQERLVERQEEKERRLAASGTKHLAELLGLTAKELYAFLE